MIFHLLFIVVAVSIQLGAGAELSVGTRPEFYFLGGESGDNGKRTVTDGERRVLLECSVSNSQDVEFRWTLDGKAVENTTRRHQTGSNLFISRVVREYDSGQFQCIASNTSSGFTLTGPELSLNIIWISAEASVHLSAPSKLTEIKPGVDVILECRVQGPSEVNFQWFRNGKPADLSDERLMVRSKWLHVNSAGTDDNGSYTCKASNDAGTALSEQKFDLIIEDERIPRILIPPVDQIAKKNSRAQLDCVYQNNAPRLWYFEEHGPLRNNSRYTTYPNGSLQIERVGEGDAGIYKCLSSLASFPEESQIYSASLRIAKLEQLNTESLDPTPLIPGHKLGLPRNSISEIFCDKPKGLPSPRVWWEGPNGKLIPNLTSPSSENPDVRVRDSSNILLIRNVRQELSGNYTCLAKNMDGITRVHFHLVVTSPPSILGHPLSTIAEEGEVTKFVCQFRGPDFPVSRVRWLKNFIAIPEESSHPSASRNEHPHHPRIRNHEQNATLVISPVLLSDAGNYTCEIITTGFSPVRSGPAQLIVTETLKFMPKPVDRRLELDSTSKIHCKAYGAPTPIVKWVKKGQPIFQWPNHIHDQNGTLYFQRVKKSDSGNYTCVATNSQGLINTTIYVDVIVSPRFTLTPQNPTEAVEGESLLIQCLAEGDPPPTIQWDKDTSRSGLDHKRFQIMENGSLLIREVSREDDGHHFGCTAGNSGGFKREEVILIVKTNDEYISESLDNTNVMTRTVSITLSVAAGYMLLVIGLMLWCRYRQLKRKQAYLAELGKETGGDAELKDGGQVCNGNGVVLMSNGRHIKPDSCRESLKSDGEIGKSCNSFQANGKPASTTASVASHRSQVSQQSKRSICSNYDKISASRNDLQFVMLLGHGEFGEVFLAKAKNIRETEEESLVMVKSLQTRDEAILFEFKRELDMYHKLSHDNVTKLVRLCREMDPHYMIMEYSDWGDLKQFLLATRKDHPRMPKPPSLTMSQIVQVVTHVALGMEHLTNHRFVHKDLATRNCLISTGLKIQVSNPGLSRDTYSSEYFKFRNQVVPIRWLPYEAIYEDEYSCKSDVWSFACLVWEVVQQAAIPFARLSNEALLESLEKKELCWNASEMEELVPKSLQHLLSQCWDPSPKNRPSFSSIVLSLAEISREDFDK